ncbi:hypothetical protein GH722_00490 [Alphaproteobacteria bacterium HT1-32]|nr:hypothetical protein [Alphaproteobacteria bacterium HT1-32]
MMYAVYIATTDGPVRIQRLQPESAPLSEVFIGRGVTPLGFLSAGFDNFMQPGRPPHTAFGPFSMPGFRMDLSSPVESGESWQLAVFLACGLARSGLLAGPNDAVDVSLCLTGRVDADLTVRKVGHLDIKLEKLRGLITRVGHPVKIFVPADELPEATGRSGNVTAVDDALEVFDQLGLPRPESARKTTTGKSWTLTGKAGAVCLVLGLLGFLIYEFRPGNDRESPEDRVMTMEQVADLAPRLAVNVLRPPSGESCAAVHFGNVQPVQEDVPLHNNAVRLSVSPLLCGLSFVIRAATRGENLSTYADFQGARVAEMIGQPGEASLPVRFADQHEWSVMLPALLSEEFNVTVFAMTTGEEPVARRLNLSVTP